MKVSDERIEEIRGELDGARAQIPTLRDAVNELLTEREEREREIERLEDERRMHSERHVNYLNRMGPILEDIREKRHTGEPAQSDFYEVQKLRTRAESAESENAALREQIEEVWKMTCEEKCGWNCCSHQIREFLDKKASE